MSGKRRDPGHREVGGEPAVGPRHARVGVPDGRAAERRAPGRPQREAGRHSERPGGDVLVQLPQPGDGGRGAQGAVDAVHVHPRADRRRAAQPRRHVVAHHQRGREGPRPTGRAARPPPAPPAARGSRDAPARTGSPRPARASCRRGRWPRSPTTARREGSRPREPSPRPAPGRPRRGAAGPPAPGCPQGWRRPCRPGSTAARSRTAPGIAPSGLPATKRASAARTGSMRVSAAPRGLSAARPGMEGARDRRTGSGPGATSRGASRT